MRGTIWLAAALVASWACAQGKPVSLVVNGGFEGVGGWSFAAGTHVVASDRGGRCVEVNGDSAATQEVVPEGEARTFSCSVELKTENVVPGQPNGYAYAAVYQLDATGQWVAFRDFVQLQGTNGWRRADFTFDLVPRATVISLRCGIFNATGKAWFDNWTLVEGSRAFGMAEVAAGAAGGRADESVAIFREPGFPARGAASSPDRLGKLLSDAGLKVTYLSAEELARPGLLRPTNFSTLVLPYGESFPAVARPRLISYLHTGGSFISTGGYAFNHLLLRQGQGWDEERKVQEARLAAALEHNLLPDGSFETTRDAPIGGGTMLDANWRRDGDICTLVAESPKEGKRCAKVVVSPDQPRDDRWYLDLKPQLGLRYRISGWIRTKDVTPIGGGFAYMALYEYGEGDKLGPWQDFAHVTGTHDWQRFQYDFWPAADTRRLHIKMGLYHATGTAWFDDIRLANISDTEAPPMNTSTGTPGDGLGVAPSQIGVFDAGFPLRRAATAAPAGGQFIFGGGELAADLSGWAAAGTQGSDNARWVQLLQTTDRFGRERGAAGALMLNSNGFFAGSLWGYFGVENRDLFDGSQPWLDRGFVSVARFIARALYLRNFTTDLASYRAGEPVKLSVVVANLGSQERACRVAVSVEPDGQAAQVLAVGAQAVTLAGGESKTLEMTWKPESFSADSYRAVARLELAGAPVDEIETGFILLRDEVAQRGPQLRFHDNYFHLDGRPMFLFGSDTYGNVYSSSCENPWTWRLDHVAARDFGFNVYENLQFCNPPTYLYTDAQWRQFEGMAQSCMREGLVFMPCQLCGHNVAIGEELLTREAAECKAYAAHLGKIPGLLYYLNGDFGFAVEDKPGLTALWNQWLADRYKSAAALQQSWGAEVYGEWGKLAYPPPGPPRWDSTREVDHIRFDQWLTRRWVERHVAAVRSEDPVHPITSEYYQRPGGAIDLILTIGSQDASNFGYFDTAYRDEEYLPFTLRLNDLRMRGKSTGLGEYGVKTHPAWGAESSAGGYHVVRTEEEQKRLFMTVAHYGFAMGAAKVQNWCLRDASEWCFPWGVFYPNGRVPKDVAYFHRNLSLVWRHFRPKYVAPTTAVLLPDGLRVGANYWAGSEVAFNAFRALMGAHQEFNVINEQDVAALTRQTKVLIWPCPACPDEAAYQKVLQWVKDGGTLYVTGDLSRDSDRKRTRTERLKELCGVEFVKELDAPPNRNSAGAEDIMYRSRRLKLRPCIQVRAAGATVLAKTESGDPVIVENRVGAGLVRYCTDPLEMGNAEQVVPIIQVFHEGQTGPAQAVGGMAPPAPKPEIHVCHQPLADGGDFALAYNTRMPPGAETTWLETQLTPQGHETNGPVGRLRVAARYPAMMATTGGGEVIAVGCSGQAEVMGDKVVSGDAQVIYLALDRKSLAFSSAVLLCPFSTGKTALNSRQQWRDPVMVIGDIADGRWRTLETRSGKPQLTLDEDLMTTLVLICERPEIARWTSALSEAMRHPERMK